MIIDSSLLSLLQWFHVLPGDPKQKYTFPIYEAFLHSKSLSLSALQELKFLLLVKHLSELPHATAIHFILMPFVLLWSLKKYRLMYQQQRGY